MTKAKNLFVRQKFAVDCVSADPDDCLVWCQRAFPSRAIRVVPTTFEAVTASLRALNESCLDPLMEGGYLGWYRGICQEEIDEKLVYDILSKLADRGYKNPSLEDRLDPEKFYELLYRFQFDRALPIGGLN